MARHAKPKGRSEVIARLRKVEGWNDKRFVLPVVRDDDTNGSECDCAKPSDNDQGWCMNCRLRINYISMK